MQVAFHLIGPEGYISGLIGPGICKKLRIGRHAASHPHGALQQGLGALILGHPCHPAVYFVISVMLLLCSIVPEVATTANLLLSG